MTGPQIDLDLHHRPKGASDVIAFGVFKAMSFRADEVGPRDVSHGFANALCSLPAGKMAPCTPPVVLEPNWKAAA